MKEKEERERSVMAKRRAVAFSLVVLLALPPMVYAALQGLGGGREAVAVQADAPLGDLQASSLSDAEELLDAFESRLQDSERPLPSRFEEEIGVLADARDVRVSEDGTVVGYLAHGTEENVLIRVSRVFGSRGWSCIPLGSVTGATFMKDDGSLRWALVTCTQVDEATSVVVRCPELEGA